MAVFLIIFWFSISFSSLCYICSFYPPYECILLNYQLKQREARSKSIEMKVKRCRREIQQQSYMTMHVNHRSCRRFCKLNYWFSSCCGTLCFNLLLCPQMDSMHDFSLPVQSDDYRAISIWNINLFHTKSCFF